MTKLTGLFIGLLGGYFGGLIGVGGGIIMIPLMTRFGGMSQIQAHGTSLLAIIFTALVGSVSYLSHGSADWRAAAIVAFTAIFTARLGAQYANRLPERRLKRAFGIFVACMSSVLLAKGFLSPSPGLPDLLWQTVFYTVTGSVTGFVSGMMGVGGGAVMVPLMVILAGMSQHIAQGTSLLAMVPTAMSGAWTHYRLGNVRQDIAVGLAIGSILGSFFGAETANMIPQIYLKVLFSLVGFWLAFKYIR